MNSKTLRSISRQLAIGLAGLALALAIGGMAALSPAWALVIFRPIPIKPQPLMPRLSAIAPQAGHLPLGASQFKLGSLESSSQLGALSRLERPSALTQLNAFDAFKTQPVKDFSSLLALQRKSSMTLAERVQTTPGAVLSKLLPQLGADAIFLAPAVKRRALVALTHDDKVQVRIDRKSAELTDADVASIADDLSAIIAEGALPLDNEARPAWQIAEAFVDSATRVQNQGLWSTSQQPDQVLLRAAVAASDPLMGVSVSKVHATREAGTVDFRVTHAKFAGNVQFEAYRFATEVAKQPNSPNIDKLSLLPALW